MAVALYAWQGLGPQAHRKVSVGLIAAPAVVAWLLTVRFLRAGGAGHGGAKAGRSAARDGAGGRGP